jgi:hypothetical protein
MSITFRPLFAALISAIAVLSTPGRIQAFGGPPGGPSSNGSYFSNNGTFSAVLRGMNLTGTLQFSTTEGSGPVPSSVSQTTTGIGNTAQTSTISSSGLGGVGSTGVAFIYFNGSTYEGNSQGSYNPESSGMTVTYQAQSAGQGNGNIVLSRRYVSTTTTNGTTTTTQETLPIKTVNYYDSKTINGFANCKTSNVFPNQKFKGSGEAVVQELNFTESNSDPFVQTIGPLKVSLTGVRLSNTASSFNTMSIVSPSVSNTATLTNP